MRVCHVIESASAGSGCILAELALAGLAAGDAVTVVYAPARAEAAFVEKLSAAPGLRLIASPMRRKIGLHDIGDFLRLLGVLRRAGPFDIVHSHSSKAGALARLARPFLPRAAYIHTPHAFVTMDPDAPRLFRWLENLLGRLADAIIVVSAQEEKHAAEALRIARKKIRRIANGAALDYPAGRGAARARLKAGPDDFLIGFVGRLTPQKNPLRLIDAFARVAAARGDARLVIVGQGPLQDKVERALAARKLSPRACIVSVARARDLMPGFDCLACSSDYEAFPVVMLEALAAGVPIATTPVGGSDETVIPGRTGFVARDFSARALADALLQPMALPAGQRAALSCEARAHARLFSRDIMASRTRNLYRELARRLYPAGEYGKNPLTVARL